MRHCENKKERNGIYWKMIGGLALAALAVGLIANFHDIKRYIRITTM